MKKKIKYIKHIALLCTGCDNVIISWYRHDYKICECEKCSIDGGFDYTQISGNKGDFKTFIICVPEWVKKEGK